MAIRVLVVDDSSFMRSMIKRMIDKSPDLEVVGTAKDGAEGVAMAEELKPDVVTMDIEMPVMNGLEALEKIMTTNPRPVVMISTLTEEGAQATMQALEKGAVDFIPKALQSQEKNIFQMQGVLHEKVVAAAKARVGAIKPVAPAAPVHTERRAGIELVVIGSSTGGPRTLQALVADFPANLNVPVIIAQHMPPNFTKAMAERMNQSTSLEVSEIKDNEMLLPGRVYVCPGGMHTRVGKTGAGLVAQVREDKGESFYKPSVDVLAQSAHDALGQNVLAVMLTGMGDDGAKAFAALRQKGAFIIAQDEATSVVYGMPKAVATMGGADEILPINSIAQRIKTLLS